MTRVVSSDRRDALVLDLDTRAGLCIARGLGSEGYRLAVAARDGAAPGLRTRHAEARFTLPRPDEDFAAYVDAVVGAAEESRAEVVLASIDSSLAVLHRHRDALGRVAIPAVGSFAAVELACDKRRTLELAASLGVPVPRAVLLEADDGLEAALDEVGLPAVLKPTTSWRPLGTGSERVEPLLVATLEEARAGVARLLRPHAPLLVQELATGARETCKLFRQEGRVTARLTMRAERTWPLLGGSTVMRETVPENDTLELAERLVDAVGLDGYSEVEFRRTAAGRPLLMEINPRLSQSVEVATRAGIDFPRMQLEWARGGRVPSAPRQAVGVRVGWLGGDVRILVAALTGRAQPRPALAPTVRAIAGDYLLGRARLEGADLHDARPMLLSVARLAPRPGRGRRAA